MESLFVKVADDKDDFKIKRERKEVKKAKKDDKYKQFIADIMKYSSETPILGNRKQKVSKVIKSLLEERKKVGRYTQHFVKLNGNQIYDILQKCIQGNT